MKSWTAVRIRSLAAAALASAIALPLAARAGDDVTPPPVPDNLKIDEGNEPFLVGHAFGTQNYVCLPTSTGVGYSLFTPEATLLNGDEKQIITHYFSPNPHEPNPNPAALFAVGPIRATWQSSRDGSTVWGKVNQGDASTDANFVEKGAIAWVKVTVTGADRGTTGGGALFGTTFIQRLNTHGGAAPSTNCATASDVGHLAFVPYTADYFFFRAIGAGDEQ